MNISRHGGKVIKMNLREIVQGSIGWINQTKDVD
jgi:hypothetical protein